MSSVSAAEIEIRDLRTLEDYTACCELQEEIWGQGFSERVPAAILRVSQKIGGISAGAFAPDGQLLGFVFGMTGVQHGTLVHWSDMLAVREGARGHHLGDHLKQYQRDRVRELGVVTMLWTFDPLVARNAHFNINRLGARPTEYVTDMYGANTGSSLHGTLPTDRFIAAWDLTREWAPPPNAGRGCADDAQIPLLHPLDAGDAASYVARSDAISVRVQVPVDFSAVQKESRELALQWRLGARAIFTTLLDSRFTATRFVRGIDDTPPYYVLTRSGD
jgi:chorismate synthase